MHKAYDTILQTEVAADLAAHSGGFDPYRYECACCGEEVFVAAPYSVKQATHFRHRSGNNDVECENYLGQNGMIITYSHSRKSNRERAEFYYENINKTFGLEFRFSGSEIQVYEQQNAKLKLRTKDSDMPFYSLSISSLNFTPDVPTRIQLNRFSQSYYMSNTLNGVERPYIFIKKGNIPTFFKMQGNDNDFKAKLVRSTVLYTHTQYFVALQNQYSTPRCIQFPNGIQVSETYTFETMSRKYFGMVLSISNKTTSIDDLLQSWGYQLEECEALTLLWPPTPVIDDISVIKSNYAYMFTSFELQAHGNINVRSEDIIKVNHNISKILVNSKVKIFKKNAETVIDKVELTGDICKVIIPTKSTENIFNVTDDSSFFLFNNSGVSPLRNGQVVFLTPNSTIVRYENNYLVSYIYPCDIMELSGEELLKDILLHYKRTEVFDLKQFDTHSLSIIASQYINSCGISGSINSIAKLLIEEGRI